jgi:hypothetical protein
VELIDVLECLPACVLGFFLSFAMVPEDGCGQVYTSSTMTENQLVERFSITLLRQINQLMVCRNGSTKSFHGCGNKQVPGHDTVMDVSFFVSIKSAN